MYLNTHMFCIFHSELPKAKQDNCTGQFLYKKINQQLSLTNFSVVHRVLFLARGSKTFKNEVFWKTLFFSSQFKQENDEYTKDLIFEGLWAYGNAVTQWVTK